MPRPERRSVTDELRRAVAAIEAGGGRAAGAVVSLGHPALDAALPWGGLRAAGLHEVLGPREDAARLGFAAAVLGRLPRTAGPIFWCRVGGHGRGVDGRLHPPGLTAFGLLHDRLLCSIPTGPIDALRIVEEAARCPDLAAVVGEGAAVAPLAARRLQLAAAAGGTLLLLLPPSSAVPPPSVALTRWRVASSPAAFDPAGLGRARWSVALERCRGGGRGSWLLEWDDEALRFRLPADPADRSLAAAE